MACFALSAFLSVGALEDIAMELNRIGKKAWHGFKERMHVLTDHGSLRNLGFMLSNENMMNRLFEDSTTSE